MTIGQMGRLADSRGDIQQGFWGGLSDKGSLDLIGQNVYFEPEGYSSPRRQPSDPTSLYVPYSFWGQFASIPDVAVSASGGSNLGYSSGTVGFLGDFPDSSGLSALKSFAIDAAVIDGAGHNVTIAAPSIYLLNRGGSAAAATSAGFGSLTLTANEIYVGEGPLLSTNTSASDQWGLLLSGFGDVNFNALNDITFRGAGASPPAGSLGYAFAVGGNLNLKSACIATSDYEDADTAYTAPNVTIGVAGALTTQNSGGTADTHFPGGVLDITAASIDHGAIIDVPSGDITLTATNGSITLESGSQIVAQASQYGPGGNILLETDNGLFTMNQGAVIDVGAPTESQGDSGSISIIAPSQTALLDGTFNGASSKGAGGSFTLDTMAVSDFSSLYQALGDFTNSLNIRARTGAMDVTGKVTANQVKLTADAGDIVLESSGVIDAADSSGDGAVELYAGNNLTVSGQIVASGVDKGSRVVLGSSGGTLNLGGAIDVSGSQGGTVYLVAPVNSAGTNVNMSLSGTITGAARILAESVLYGNPNGVSSTPYEYADGTLITSTSKWQTGIQNFMSANGSNIQNNLKSGLTLDSNGEGFQFVPGLEIDSQGSLTLSTPWDFTTWTANVGMLTIRAAGNLTIKQNLVDHPSGVISQGNGKSSWGMTLVSGADLSSSEPTAVVEQTGPFQSGVNDLTIANGKVVYSESAPVSLAAGGDIIVGSGGAGYMINSKIAYNVGTFNGPITVMAGHDLDLNSGVIQSAIGNIDVNAHGDLNLVNGALGAIRTTGEALSGASANQYWTYGNGGNIVIDVGGNVNGEANGYVTTVEGEGWDSYNMKGSTAQGWSANYTYNANTLQASNATEGLATMAGGNLTVYAGGSFSCQAGTFAGVSADGTFAADSSGNLTIFSQGDMQGRFLVANGNGKLNTMGNFGSVSTHPVMELLHASLEVTAQGDIDAGAVVNPTITRPAGPSSNYTIPWDLQYAPTTSVSLTSVLGNVSLYGDDSFYSNSGLFQDDAINLLPPTVRISAARDINLLADTYTLAPASKGELSLTAGGNINGLAASGNSASIAMSEMPDALQGQDDTVYGPQSGLSGTNGGGVTGGIGSDPAGILHSGDDNPIVIRAGGDISNLSLYLPKQADITSGRNIENIFYDSHNDNSTDITKIVAGGAIMFNSVAAGATGGGESGILMGGPGTLAVEAGDSIDLGTSQGIQSLGNAFNNLLGGAGCTVVVASGYTKDFSDTSTDPKDTNSDVNFFSALQGYTNQYAQDMAKGDTADALKVRADAENLISTFLANSTTQGSGDINMTLSQISTLEGAAGIFILSNGNLQVGVTNISSGGSQSGGSGIFTAEGGDISIFANKDINVNESRIMTFFGGDITAWSDTGNVNAGRGSKTAISASPPTVKYINGQSVLVFSPPAVGSGIRAVTYAPGYGLPAPDEGDIYLYARQTIDAGEAGIAGGTVILAATQVLNSNNISFSVGSVGVPVSSQGLGGLTALSGVGSVTQGIGSAEAAVMNAANSGLAQSMSEGSFLSASVDVSVLSFFDPDDKKQ